jgi:glyoxylase-like metal-dependent hydrolase (beta-lactamase superfamily II)
VNLVQVSQHCFAVLNERNLICDATSGLVALGRGLIVDTQADLAHARRMLEVFGELGDEPPAFVVNTHEDIDHVAGNQLVGGAEIVGHRAVAARMGEVADPARLVRLHKAAAGGLGRLVLRMRHPGLLATAGVLADYRFDGIELRPPGRVFEERMELDLDGGGAVVELIHVGPAHQAGDTIVHVPGERVVFAGDVVFRGVAPMGWVGSTDSWLAALDVIESLGPEVIVPGHGPVCGMEGVRDMRAYLERVRSQARSCFEQGMTSVEAAKRVDLGPFGEWNAADARVWMGVERVYRECRGEAADAPWDVAGVFDMCHAICRARGAVFAI